jgi:uncharacterized membrane protein YfcA
MGMDYPQARIINLLFFLPSAVTATLFHRKQGSVKIKKILPGILFGCIAAAAASYIGKQINVDFIKKLFGGLLLFTGARELFYKPKGNA